MNLSKKQILGQYYTVNNVFSGSAFDTWFDMVPKEDDIKFLEPFAGAGNINKFFPDYEFDSFDIEPNASFIQQRDTIKDFPKGYKVCITNPPYLAKNSVKRKKQQVFFEREDLYLDCLELMLKNCEYVAAIIPSTFYGTKLFRERLLAWDKLDMKPFEDTDNPVGVAYFVPEEVESKIYVNGSLIEKDEDWELDKEITFNVANGNYVLTAIDTTKEHNIKIEPLNETTFDRKKFLKHTSRNYSLFYSPNPIDCDSVNASIEEWRKETKDFYLTSFKSLMKCGKYRKRISFETLRMLIKRKSTEEQKDSETNKEQENK